MESSYEQKIAELEQKLSEQKREINSLKLAVRAENIKVKISSEYSNFGLWEYDIADDICYQYKKLNGIYETKLDPIRNFRDTIISWGNIYADDLPVFHRFCDALERGDVEMRYDVRAINDYNEIAWFRYEGKTIFDDNGKPVRVVGRTIDVTEEKGGIGADSDERRDSLTGALVYNEFVRLATARSQDASEFKNSALVVIGIDSYAELSASQSVDTDDIQRSLAKVLTAQSAVEQGSLFSRADDGVFVFYVKFRDIPTLNSVISRIIYRFNDIGLRDSTTARAITISAGISIFKFKKQYSEAYSEAQTALTAAQLKGGNGYLQFNSSMNDTVPKSSAAVPAFDNVSGAAGAEKIYHLINIALSDNENGKSALAAAICLSGEYTNSSYVYICSFNGDSVTTDMPWSADNTESYNDYLPSVAPVYGTDAMKKLLSEDEIIILSDRLPNNRCGFRLQNGAVCAVCCPIKCADGIAGYIAYVADKTIIWQQSDIELINMIVRAINHLNIEESAAVHRKKRNRLFNTMISNMRLESFTIVPDTYEVDYVSASTMQKYDLRPGDKCYRKIRGLDSPCVDCPAHQLKSGQLTASNAFYEKNDSRWIDITAGVCESDDGSERYVISMIDITNCITNIQSRDALTGVMGFDRFAVDAMRLTAERPDCGFITVINIANFRHLNEEKGYEFGNSILITVSDILSSTLREDELLCRSEGARFVALYRNSNSEDLLRRINQMLASAQSQVLEKCGIQIFLIAGVYELSGENTGIMAALDRAIIAQKTIKNRAYYTSNMVAFYDNALREELQARSYIESSMVEALENNEFKVYYQPKVNTATGEIEGAEALVRWIRPNGEIISPAKFVPLFEQNGFIADMDFAIYRQAVADIKRWIREGIKVPLISLNVSRHHMRDDTFPEKICALVDSLGVPRNNIELEITESMLTENLNHLLDAVTTLRNAGFRISVDDFGSGYSSLNLITLMPFDTLKIDGGFFLKNELTDKNKTVITTIVELAKNLNFTTVSEGVETDEQVEFLRKLGCDLIQGYYYYKPMPVADFEQLLK
ncbi:MAG: EAL domain-containing protein [Oscillospiraceae bacterium]